MNIADSVIQFATMTKKGIGNFILLASFVALLLTAASAQRHDRSLPSRNLAPAEQGAEGVFSKAASKVVFIVTRNREQPHARGSGIILSSDGYIATNYHVLEGADSVEVRFFPRPDDYEDYQSFNSAKLIFEDADRDIAILKITSTSLPFLSCETSECAARIGERVFAIGNPKGLSNTISEGIVSALRVMDGENTVQHTAAVSPGSSGGALVNAEGQLLGMNSWQVADGQNLNFAICAKHLTGALAAARQAKVSLPLPHDVLDQASSSEADQSIESAIAALRNIVSSIKSCPQTIKFENGTTDGPLSGYRLYYGPPLNVVWDVARSDSIRGPYKAYLEFSIPRENWVPPDVWRRWAGKASPSYVELIAKPMSPIKYRYEFDVGPGTIHLTRTLFHSGEGTDWDDAPGDDRACSRAGCDPTCWLSAAERGQIPPKQAEP